jgi:hypothetical protein
MSSVNIRRAVENIKFGINIYTPLVELVVNAIQAIKQNDNADGKVEILIKRALSQMMMVNFHLKVLFTTLFSLVKVTH